MLKACSPRFRACVLLPFLFACSIAKPVADLSVNLGAISGLARIAALASIPDFLQGINLGLLFLEHDWTRHPIVFQRLGMTASLAALSYLFVAVDLNSLPVFFQLWRPYGMLQFLWMATIWYAAHGKDVLCTLFEVPLLSYLGNTSFGVYIAQQLLIDYKWQNDPFLLTNKYPRVWEFALILTIMGGIGYHTIQLPYNPYITKEGTAMLKRYRASRLAKAVNLLWTLPETLLGRALVTLAFIPAYVAYVSACVRACVGGSERLPAWACMHACMRVLPDPTTHLLRSPNSPNTPITTHPFNRRTGSRAATWTSTRSSARASGSP